MRKLSKRFPRAEEDVLREFKSGPPQTRVPLPAFQCLLWKARAPSSDLQRGKSGGFRIIYFWDGEMPNFCLLGACYFKGDCEDLAPKEYLRLYGSLRSRLADLKQRHEKDGDKEAEIGPEGSRITPGAN